MNKKGFTLIELISAMALLIMVAVVFWGIVGRTVFALREISIRNELFEIGEVTENILKRQMEKEIMPDYLYLPDGKGISYEDFSGGEFRVLFFKEKFYNPLTREYVEQYRAFSHKADTEKLLFQDRVDSPKNTSILGVGGYDCATHIRSIKLYKMNETTMRFLIDFHRGEVSYEKEIVLYPNYKLP